MKWLFYYVAISIRIFSGAIIDLCNDMENNSGAPFLLSGY
jgi:hypothetical protein